MGQLIVKSQQLVDAFKSLGIAATLEGGDGGTPDELSVLKGQVDTLTKAVEDKDREIQTLKESSGTTGSGDLMKSEVLEQFSALGLITKTVLERVSSTADEVADIRKSFEDEIADLKSEISTIADNPIRRSLNTQDQGISKAFTVDEKTGKKTLSKGAHGKVIVELLDSLSESEALDDVTKGMYSDAAVRFETSRALNANVINDLRENHDIVITD